MARNIRSITIILILLSLGFLFSCGKDSEDGPGSWYSIDAPTGISITEKNQALELFWGPMKDVTFRVYYGTEEGAYYGSGSPFSTTVNTYTISGLENGTKYYVAVTAVNEKNVESKFSEEVSGTPSGGNSIVAPTVPSGLNAFGVSSSAIQLSWNDNSDNEDGFKIERSNSISGTYSEITTVGVNATSWVNNTLSPGTTYYYKIRAYNSAGNSAYTSVASGTTQAIAQNPPNAPSGLSASAVSSSQINLAWTDNSTDENGFKIYRSLSSSSGYSLVATISTNQTSWNNTGLNSSTAYYYRIYSYNDAGDSTTYAQAGTTTQAPSVTVPESPTGLLADAVSSSQINLSWNDNSGNEDGFKIQRSLSSSSGYTQITTVGAGVTSFNNPGLAPGTTYYYRVYAYNSAGDSSSYSQANDTTYVALPGAPVITSISGGNQKIMLGWSAVSGATSYSVYHGTSSGSYGSSSNVGSTTSYEITGLTNGTTYYVVVSAHNAQGESPMSAEQFATPNSNAVWVDVDPIHKGYILDWSSPYEGDPEPPVVYNNPSSLRVGYYSNYEEGPNRSYFRFDLTGYNLADIVEAKLAIRITAAYGGNQKEHGNIGLNRISDYGVLDWDNDWELYRAENGGLFIGSLLGGDPGTTLEFNIPVSMLLQGNNHFCLTGPSKMRYTYVENGHFMSIKVEQ